MKSAVKSTVNSANSVMKTGEGGRLKGEAGKLKGRATAGHSGIPGFLLALGLGLMCSSGAVMAEEPAAGQTSLTDVEGTSIYADEEEPRVRHSVAWQLPAPVQREPQAPDLSGAEGLLDPIDVEVFKTHRHFRQTLDILNVDRNGPSE